MFAINVSTPIHHCTVFSGKRTYEEVIDAVRKNEVYAALVNTDIASWMQVDIKYKDPNNPLSFVFEIKTEIPIRMLNVLLRSKKKSWKSLSESITAIHR